jgi:transcriptional regulator
MHPNRKFHIQDREAMAALVGELGFGILFVSTSEGPRAVHVPVLLDGDRLRFHVSRGNAVHATLLAGADALFVASGPHAYISPEWYGLEDRVPTWNYVAVELEGPVAPLDSEALAGLLDAMSAEQEARLAPKPAWTRARMSEGRFEALLKSITGFEMRIAAWRGTAKVDQDKPQAVRDRIAEALAERGEPDMAAAMRAASPPLHSQGRETARSAVEGASTIEQPLHRPSDGPPPRAIAGRN